MMVAWEWTWMHAYVYTVTRIVYTRAPAGMRNTYKFVARSNQQQQFLRQ
jgi:hypothetical protein